MFMVTLMRYATEDTHIVQFKFATSDEATTFANIALKHKIDPKLNITIEEIEEKAEVDAYD